MRHEVIIYRNPWEAFFFDNPQYVLWALGIGVAVVAAFILLSWALEKIRRNRRSRW